MCIEGHARRVGPMLCGGARLHSRRQLLATKAKGDIHELAVAMAEATAVESVDEAWAMAEAKACEKPGADDA